MSRNQGRQAKQANRNQVKSESEADDFEVVTEVKVKPKQKTAKGHSGRKPKSNSQEIQILDGLKGQSGRKKKSAQKTHRHFTDAGDEQTSDEDAEGISAVQDSCDEDLEESKPRKGLKRPPIHSGSKREAPTRHQKSNQASKKLDFEDSKPSSGSENEDDISILKINKVKDYRNTQIEGNDELTHRKSPHECDGSKKKGKSPKEHKKCAKKVTSRKLLEEIDFSSISSEPGDSNDETGNDDVKPTRKVCPTAKDLNMDIRVKVRISPTEGQVKDIAGSSTEDEPANQVNSDIAYPAQSRSSRAKTRKDLNRQDDTDNQTVPSKKPRRSSSHDQNTRDNNSVPFSGVSASPDLFVSQAQGEEEDNKENEVKPRKTETGPDDDETQDMAVDDDETQEMAEGPDGPVPVDHIPEPEYFDVFYESAKHRSADGPGMRKITNDSGDSKDEESVDGNTCTYCRAPHPASSRQLVNKRKLRMKLVDPAPYFAPPGVSAGNYAKTISGFFRKYFAQIRVIQRNSNTKIRWGEPVLPGRHCHKTLLAKGRRHSDFDDDDNDDLPDLRAHTKPSVSDRTQRNIRRKIAKGEFTDDMDEDFVALPSTSRGAKMLGKSLETSKVTGKTTHKKQTEREMFTEYFRNDKSVIKKKDKSAKDGECSSARDKGIGDGKGTEFIYLDEGSNEGFIPSSPQVEKNEKNASAKKECENSVPSKGVTYVKLAEIGDVNEESNDSLIPAGQSASEDQLGVSQGRSDTTASRSSQASTRLDVGQQLRDLSNKEAVGERSDDFKHEQGSFGSNRSSPLAFKLTGEGTMAYDDDVLDDEVEDIFKKKAKTKLKRKRTRSKSPTPPEPAKRENIAFGGSLVKGDEINHENLDAMKTEQKQDDDDFKLFEDHEEDIQQIESPDRSKSTTGVVRKKLRNVNTETNKVKTPTKVNQLYRSPKRETVQPKTEENSQQEANRKKVGRVTGRKSPGFRKVTRQTVTETEKEEETTVRPGPMQALANKIIQRIPVMVNPYYRGVPHATAPVPRPQSPPTEAATSEMNIECPLCSKLFSKETIEFHASSCEGPNSTPEVIQGNQRIPEEPVIEQRTRTARRATPAFAQGAPQTEERREPDNVNHSPRRRPRDRQPEAPDIQPQPPMEEEPSDLCPICNLPQPYSILEQHVNDCLTRQEIEASEPAPPRRTRNSGPTFTQNQTDRNQRLTLTAVQGASGNTPRVQRPKANIPLDQVIDLDESDDESNQTADVQTGRRKRARQP